jgi:DNA-binding IclR family transcriptional regulator
MALLQEFKARRGDWPALRKDIDKAIESVRRRGWCVASWQPEIVALATPLMLENERPHVLNVSVSSEEPVNEVAAELKGPLLALAREIVRAFEAREPDVHRLPRNIPSSPEGGRIGQS